MKDEVENYAPALLRKQMMLQLKLQPSIKPIHPRIASNINCPSSLFLKPIRLTVDNVYWSVYIEENQHSLSIFIHTHTMSCKSICIVSNSTRTSRIPIPSSSNFKIISYGCFNSSPENVFWTLYYHSSGTKTKKKYYVGNVKRRSLAIHCACSLGLPLLPFPLEQVLIPSERKSLHLYEARYLKLLDESVSKKKLFVHFVLDPIVVGSVTSEPSFAARYGCLVEIEKVERLDVGP